jgi:hypothetical protein
MAQVLHGRARIVQYGSRCGQAKTQRTDANVDSVRTLVSSDRRLGCYLEVLTRLQESVRKETHEL